MNWVMRPVHTGKYTLRSGVERDDSDPTHYVPGTRINLYLTVTDYDWKYRGLFVRGVDQQNNTVGRFDFPGRERQLWWEPPACPGQLIHNTAELKPLRSELVYVAPPASTGKITFQVFLSYFRLIHYWLRSPRRKVLTSVAMACRRWLSVGHPIRATFIIQMPIDRSYSKKRRNRRHHCSPLRDRTSPVPHSALRRKKCAIAARSEHRKPRAPRG